MGSKKSRMRSPHTTLLLRLLIPFFFVLSGIPGYAQEEIRVSGNFSGLSLQEFMTSVEEDANVRFYYEAPWIDSIRIEELSGEFDLMQALNLRLNSSGFSASLVFKNYVIIHPSNGLLLPQDYAETTDYPPDAVIIGEGENANAVIEGYIRDAKTGQPLPGASVLVKGSGTGSVTNMLGFYSLDLEAGEYKLEISYLGWTPEEVYVVARGNGSLDIELFEEVKELKEVTITAFREDINITGPQMSSIELDAKMIKKIPPFLGEPDVLKSIVLLPGVTSVGEGAAGFNVRGGSIDQNLVLFDGVPIFNTSHLFGFYSVFNPDVIQDFTLVKGGIPARYGGRISSVLDLNTREGNSKEWTVQGGIGNVAARVSAEGPIIEDKLSLNVGGRGVYSNYMLKLIKDAEIRESTADFYDVSARLSYRLNDNNKIDLSGYFSSDSFQFKEDTSYAYQSAIVSVNWLHILKSNLFFNLNYGYSYYNSDITGLSVINGFDYTNGLRYHQVGGDVTYFPREGIKVDAGFLYSRSEVDPGNLSQRGQGSLITPVSRSIENINELSGYISSEVTFNDRLSGTAGVRYSTFRNVGPGRVFNYDPQAPKDVTSVTDTLFFPSGEVIADYSGLEPRASLSYLVNPRSSLKVSYHKMFQYIHLLSNSAALNPFAVWQPSNEYFRPQVGEQVGLGFFRNFNDNRIETSVELFYKTLDNVISYKDNSDLTSAPSLETETVTGEGRSYGVEMYARKNTGRLTGWVSLTISKSENRVSGPFPEETINSGEYFPTNFDKPVDLSVTANYQISQRWAFSSNFVYSSGRPITAPVTRFLNNGVLIAQYSDRNQFRIPDYHRLDISLSLDPGHKKRKFGYGSWTFSILNVYGRENAFTIFFGKRNEFDPPLTPYKLSILGTAFPTITYNFRF